MAKITEYFLVIRQIQQLVFEIATHWTNFVEISRSEQCKSNVNVVDLVKSFETSIWLRNLASILPRTSPLRFAKRDLES